MPTIKTTYTVPEEDHDVEIDFEVYCRTCGCGLCNETEVKGHQAPQLRVNVCPDCMKEKDDEIAKKNNEIQELNRTIENLNYDIKQLQRELHSVMTE